MNIEFIPISEFAENILPKPMPASKFIPDWYSKMNLFIDSDSYGLAPNQRSPNTTMKACMPFLDSLTTGYMWYLPLDLEIRKNYEGFDYIFRWRTDGTFITNHDIEQHPTLPHAFNGNGFVSKFVFEFIIKTPPGYSTFFTHPLNRHDLPFRTFSGVVDTDKYNQAVQFPFQLLETNKDIFILEKNTPVCQFFPFKRENWHHKIKKYDKKNIEKKSFNFKSIIKRSYKRQVWASKEYT